MSEKTLKDLDGPWAIVCENGLWKLLSPRTQIDFTFLHPTGGDAKEYAGALFKQLNLQPGAVFIDQLNRIKRLETELVEARRQVEKSQHDEQRLREKSDYITHLEHERGVANKRCDTLVSLIETLWKWSPRPLLAKMEEPFPTEAKAVDECVADRVREQAERNARATELLDALARCGKATITGPYVNGGKMKSHPFINIGRRLNGDLYVVGVSGDQA